MPYITLRNGDVKHMTWREYEDKIKPVRLNGRPENLSTDYRALSVQEWLDEIRKDKASNR